jgi:hypothetical protein
MAGYGRLWNTKFKLQDFEGVEAEAINPITEEKTTAPNGFSFTKRFWSRWNIRFKWRLDLDYSDCTYDTRDSNQIQQAVIILKLQMNIPVSILVRSLNLTNCFYKEKGFGSCLSVKGQ